MRCILIEIPVELLLSIIDELYREEDLKARANDDKPYDEILIIYHDLFRLSRTCSFFRDLLVPDLFNAVRLIDDEKNGSFLSTLAKSQLNVHVKEVHFIGSAPRSARSEMAVFLATKGVLSRRFDRLLLCELQRFPCLEILTLSFDYRFENLCDWTLKTDISPDDESQFLEAKPSAAWQALMFRTLQALAQNNLPHLKRVVYRKLTVKAYDRAGIDVRCTISFTTRQT